MFIHFNFDNTLYFYFLINIVSKYNLVNLEFQIKMLDSILHNILFPLYGRVNRNLEVPYIIESNERARYNVFYFHSNAGVISDTTFISEMIHDQCNIIQIEYPGYYSTNKSSSSFNVDNFISEVEETFRHIIHNNVVPNVPIILVGASIGSVVAGALAKRLNSEEIHKMVLITPLAEVSCNIFPPGDLRRLLFSLVNSIPQFSNIEMLKQTKFPVLLITVVNDTIVNNYNTELLLNIRSNVKNIYIQGHHNSFTLTEEKIEFLKKFICQ